MLRWKEYFWDHYEADEVNAFPAARTYNFNFSKLITTPLKLRVSLINVRL
jgi:hypothetical protein